MSLYSKVLDAIAKRIPQKRVTRFDTRTIHNEIASTLDVDRLADILRAAEAGDCTLLFALYRDMILTHSHIQGRFSERKEAVIGDTLNIQPFDKKNPDDVIAQKVVDAQINGLQGWETACLHLLDSHLYPVAILEKIFKPVGKVVDGVMIGYEIAELAPVPHDLLDFRDGCVKIKKTDDQGRPTSETFEPDPQRYIIHRGHTLSFPDNWGGPMRSLVFWWLLGTMDREWWARFLDKYGTPFLVGKYDQADDASRSILERAFSLSTKLGGLAVSKETQIEIMQAAAKDSGDAFHVFHKVANEEISKLILGQTLSSDAKGNGLSDGGASDQAEMRQDKRQADARRLGGTLRFQLFTDIIRYNGLRGRPPTATWGATSIGEMKANADWLQALAQANLQVGDEGLDTLSERFGVPIERAPAPAAPAPGGFGGGPAPAGDDAAQATASLGAAVGLNGAQIQAALRVVEGIKAGGLSKAAGTELLKSIGIPAETAAIMADTGDVVATPMSMQIHSADGRVNRVEAANQAILRTGGARLARALGTAYAPLEALIATAASPTEALTRIETYCMTLDPIDAAEIMEGCLTAFTANGSVATKS